MDPIRLGKDLPDAIGGLSWQYFDVVITCVDSARTRIDICEGLKTIKDKTTGYNNKTPSYWYDFGNRKQAGQVVLGTLKNIDQPEREDVTAKLPTVIDLFPHLADMDEETDMPSCSVREALIKQDLFVNSMLADFGMNLFWSMFREGYIEIHGGFASLKEFTTSPLRVDADTWSRFGYKAA